MNYETITVPRGLNAKRVLQVRDGNGNAFDPVTNPGPFNGSETLTFSIWAGDETAVLGTPSVAWLDYTIGTVTLTFATTDTTSLSLGTYQGLVTATSGSLVGEILRFQVAIQATPGTETIPLAYTTTDDLLRYAFWIEDLQTDRRTVGFGLEQARATEDLIQIIVRLWKATDWQMAPGQPGFNSQSLGYTGDIPNLWLRQQITPVPVDSTHLANLYSPFVSTALLLHDNIKEYCAKKAISYICEGQIGRSSEQDYWKLARYFRSDADSLLKCIVAEIDLSVPQTGWASISVFCGGTNLR